MSAPVVNALGQRLDLDAALRAEIRVEAMNRCCWWNALAVLRRVYSRREGVRYVEGHGITRFGLIAAHAWVELEDGAIVDPTPSWRIPDDALPLYFAGERYSRRDLRGVAWNARMPLVDRAGHNRHAGFLQSELDAYRYVFGPAVDVMMPERVAYLAALKAGTA